MSRGNAVLRLELVPLQEEAETLDGQSRILNWLYNRLLEMAKVLKDHYIQTQDEESAKTLYTKRGLRNLVPKLKQEHPFLKVVHSSPLKNGALRLTEAIQAHQKSKKGKRKGRQVGFPSFRSWSRSWFSLLYDEPNKGFKVGINELTLSLGVDKEGKRRSLTLRMKNSHLLKGKTIRNLRIIKEGQHYYALFTVCKALPEKKPIQKIIALDPNRKNFAYGVDTLGNALEISAPGWLKKYDKRLDELKSKRDRCKRKSKQLPVLDSEGNQTGKSYFLPSKRWKQFIALYERVLTKRRDQTKTFVYTLAHRLCKEYDVISVGNYTPHGGGITTSMRRAMNNRSLIGRGKEILSWVAENSGKTFLIYNEKGTTRTCNRCHFIHSEGLDPSIRVWRCPQCNAEHHRDENAASNGLDVTLKLLKQSGAKVPSVSCLDLSPVKEKWAWCVTPSGVVSMPRGRSSDSLTAPGNLTTSVVACDQEMVSCQV